MLPGIHISLVDAENDGQSADFAFSISQASGEQGTAFEPSIGSW